MQNTDYIHPEVDEQFFEDYCKKDPIKGEIAKALVKEGKLTLKPRPLLHISEPSDTFYHLQ
jgi:hypothetical protein